MDTDTVSKTQGSDTMKAILEIELEMDGEYQKTDDQSIVDAILLSLDNLWIIEDERLIVITKSATCRLKGKP
jgi:hypothetical protein